MTQALPRIVPLPPSRERPLWSVMIPTFEAADALRATLRAVLTQDPGPAQMQIEVVDDHSLRDDPEAVVREVGRGRVGFFRQPRNVGHVANFNTCLERSRGELIHLLHGDDLVREGFYDRMREIFEGNPEIAGAFCCFISIDAEGRWRSIQPLVREQSGVLPDALGAIAGHQPFQSPATVVRRWAYERLGGFDPSIRVCGEDWEMGMRIASVFPLWYEVEPLALRRGHADSLTNRTTRTAENTRELRRVIHTSRAHFPTARRRELTSAARRFAALWALELADLLFQRGDRSGAWRQLWEAMLTSRAPRVVWDAASRPLYWLSAGIRTLAARG